MKHSPSLSMMGAVNFRKSLLTFTLLLAATLGCDRTPTAAPSSTASNTADEVPVHPTVEITPITPLLPRLPTHVAVDSHSNLYWVQESDPPQPYGDLVYVMGSSGVPQAVHALDMLRLLEAVGFGTDHSTTGAIRALAIGPGDSLFILFTGGSRTLPICAILRYTPGNSRVTVMADTTRVLDASGMGASVELARGSLISQGTDLWLWLRHTDAGAIVRINASENSSTATLKRLEIKPSGRIAKGQLISDLEDLAAGPGEMLYFVDRQRAMLWRIDPQGEYVPWLSLEGFSSLLTAPIVDNGGRIAFLAGEADVMMARDFSATGDMSPRLPASVAWFALPYPAFVQIQPREGADPLVVNIRRDDLLAPAALPQREMQPRQLLLDPTNRTLITFDASSGELLRLKMSHK